MSRVDVKKPSLCTSEPFRQETVRHALSAFSKMVKSCYGPTGRLKQLHNGMGGYIRTTSQSSALLGGLSVTHPILKLLTASVQNHISRFSDGGLFTAILCCSLLERFQDLNIASSTCVKISQHLSGQCIDYLTSEECGCRIPVDFNSSKILLDLVRGVLTSKRACMLSSKEADHVSTLILKAFLLMVPQNVGTSVRFGKCLYVPIKDKSVMDSRVYPGLLVETTGFHLTRMLPAKRATSSIVKTALFSVSLSGDFYNTGGGAVVHHGVSLEAAVLDQLLRLGQQMVNDGVGLVICQKVIHPALKQYLKENQVVAVERVGVAMVEPLKEMTGSQPIPSLQCLSPACYGCLKDLQTQHFASKWFLHLIPEDPAVCSLVLCNRNETAWDELKLACQAAGHVLQLTVKEPWVLLGGGCTETHLSSYIRHKSGNVPSSTLENLGCCQTEFQLVADCFCHSLESVARCLEHDGGGILTDTTWGHFWSIPPDLPGNSAWSDSAVRCGCGLCGCGHQGLTWRVLHSSPCPFPPKSCICESSIASADNPVLDCFAAKCNGLQAAVETACLLFGLSYIVEDQN